MQTAFMLSVFREDIVRALFWTLVHSLWQGLVLAILAGLVILCTRRSAPVRRCNMLLGLFCLFVMGAGITLFMELRGTAATVGAGNGSRVSFYSNDAMETPVANTFFVSSGQSWAGKVVGFFNDKAIYIVAVWFIILCIRLVKLLTNLGTVQRLRHYRTSTPGDYWKQRMQELARRIGIKSAVDLLESSLIRVPMMAGIFKPVILVPLGLLSQLPPQQVEAILLHELAHIRRKDYFINLLQSFAEMLFFFNPAVLWISSLIREERENCCDDIAVAAMQSKKEFIHALMSFQEFRQPTSRYALAFPGQKNHLLSRVKRIVHHDDKTLDIREKFFLLACLFVTAGLTLAYSRKTPPPVPAMTAMKMIKPLSPVAPVSPVVGAVKGSSPVRDMAVLGPVKPVALVKAADTSKKPALGRDTLINEPLDRISKDTLTLERTKIEDQQQRLNEARATLAEKEMEIALEQARLNEMYARIPIDTLPLRASQEALKHAQMNLARLNSTESRRMLQSQRLLEETARRLSSASRMQSDRLVLAQEHLKLAQLRLDRSARLTTRAVDSRNKVVEPILEMLMDKKLITQTNIVSFGLDKNELIVNGQKQPDDIFRIFQEAFIHDSKDYVKYNKNGEAEMSSISIHNE